MFTKKHVERILRINGIDQNASDEDIKSVLLYAKCENVEDAISALRDKYASADADICGLQEPGAKCNVLLVDKRLKPEMIKDLLGIDVALEFDDLEEARAARQRVSFAQIVGIAGFSILFAVILAGLTMWYYQIGFFIL